MRIQRQQKITWCEKCGGFEEKGGKSQEILSKGIQAGQTLSFDRPENDLPISILVVQGWYKLFGCIMFIKIVLLFISFEDSML